MGSEGHCTLTFRGRKTTGKALLETDALMFRGPAVRLSIPYGRIASVSATRGRLRVVFDDAVATFDLGSAAVRWADRIQHPPSRAAKLGVKPDARVVLIGIKDPAFRRELAASGAKVMSRPGSGLDMIFYAANARRALDRLCRLQDHLRRDGALWVIRPKGHAEITEADVMRAGRAAGLVDVKVVRFSDTHTAEKFVIPLARR